jgi:hypothetical protein
MIKFSLLVVVVFAVLGLLLFVAVAKSRASAELADYTLARNDGRFQIRDYPGMVLATASMDEGGMDAGFGKLFLFITGSNAAKEQIPMTAPVLAHKTGARKTMSFIMPTAVARREPPRPDAREVVIEKMEGGRFAALRFSGFWTEQNELAALEKLHAWCERERIETFGEPIFAFYDPPWIPWFMRRNEVLLRVKIHQE